MRELALFAGAGGGILGGHLLGWRTVCAVERDAYAASILAARQNDGCLRPFPIWSDVTSFDGRAWRGIVDVLSAGFPCTDISSAGKGAGIEGKESGLWREIPRILRDVRPGEVYLENSPMLTARGLGTVLRDLATLGYDAKWLVLGAADVGFEHVRKRIWIRATHPEWSKRRSKQHDGQNRRMGGQQKPFAWDSNWLDVFTAVRRVGDGMADRLDRTDAIRNGQVPRVAAAAWRILG